MADLAGHVTIVTGGASGIGRAIAGTFVAAGARVIIADIDIARGTALADSLGSAALFVRADVSVEADIAALPAAALDAFGRLDCMINNAGIPGVRGPIAETDLARAEREMAVLFTGVLAGMKHAAPILAAQRSGTIISISSVAGLRTGWGSHVYSAAKAAIVQLTRTVAMELGEHNVRVNCICPGGIATPLLGKGMGFAAEEAETLVDPLKDSLARWQPLPRAGLAGDIAQAALYLASDAASFVNGHALVVDGGLTGGRGWSETMAQRDARIAHFRERATAKQAS